MRTINLYLLLVAMCITTITYSQNVEVQGQLKITQVNQNDTASQVVVRNVDGSLGKRLASSIGGVPSLIRDNDNDTKIQTEKFADEDRIRIDLSGDEKFAFVKNIHNLSRIEFKNNLNNIFVGDSSGTVSNTNSNGNVAIGRKAMNANTGGDFNVAIGTESLSNINSNDANGSVCIGYQAMKNNPYSNQSIAIGYQAALNFEIGSPSTAIGFQSMFTGPGQYNTALGHKTLYTALPFAEENTVIGYEAMFGSIEGDRNVVIGNHAMRENNYSDNIAIGSRSMQNAYQTSKSIAIGSSSLISCYNSNDNVGIGSNTLMNNTIGKTNIAIGNYVLQNQAVSNFNIAIGHETMNNSTGGNVNIAIGNSIMLSNEEGSNNVSLGHFAMQSNKLGNANVAIGINSLQQLQSGGNNVAMGYGSLELNKNSGNTGIGYKALGSNVTGNFNTALGANANVGVNNLVNATAIGAFASVTASNCLVLGYDANVGIGISDPTSKLHVVGNGLFTGNVTASCGVLVCSDNRYKKDIKPISQALVKLSQLNGVTYKFKVDDYPNMKFNNASQIGVIAQEVETVFPELVNTDKDGFKSVDYAKITAILIEAVKELKNQNSSLNAEVSFIKAELGLIKESLNSKSLTDNR